ncbi:MaoC/PaaZ C-terminal domain-containing protein [Sphingopyxis fribergensis]
MPLDSSIVGARLDAVELELTPRMSLAFAAAIDDDTSAESRSLVASPFQCASFEWRSIGRARDILGATCAEMLRVVHAGQQTAFLRPLTTGHSYRVEPVVASARNTRAGALVEILSEIIDITDGEVAVRTLSAGLYRGTPLSGESETPSRPVSSPRGESLNGSLPIPIARWFPHIYTKCADIWNPIHTEPDAARAAGLSDIIVHGTALWALSANALVRAFADGNSSLVAALSSRFAGMAFPGELLTLRHGQIDPAGDLAFELVDQQGRTILADGCLTFRR